MKVLLRAPNDTLPLLLTNTPLYWLPKKLIGVRKPSDWAAVVERSSPTPRLLVLNAASVRTADIIRRDSSGSIPEPARRGKVGEASPRAFRGAAAGRVRPGRVAS